MAMVGLNFGVSLISGAEAGVSYPHVAFVPLAGEVLPFSAVWSPDNDNPALLGESKIDDRPYRALSRFSWQYAGMSVVVGASTADKSTATTSADPSSASGLRGAHDMTPSRYVLKVAGGTWASPLEERP
ncbi:MAG TPA: hypothetical protein VGU24_18140 [Microvirga sp.]|jgi:hypothetical protein|nr:hypothetical protein [Microvirga sp.]